ncbi:GntR family transcriptional regulator [Paenirhodobacter hankyongi]|uniref:GntR family transcriptional regulator n=1 Tax=Paenirhodobacter hankyongi TaxID=2294033 RepID=A0A421BL00_9RHOB|nr:GntR family transcriptional regulator [Sinirhodobacter hankyongi]RLL63622.1 GntR family transcriptional regulator [Sinirhodobacter hankyongi]
MSNYQPDTVADMVHGELRQQIWGGAFLPGDRVSIRALALERGLSVIPVRDAVRRLVAEGALCFVDSRTIEVPQLNLANHRDVLFARSQLEPELARMAFAMLDQTDLEFLVAIDAAMDAAIAAQDIPRYMQTNFEFHFRIYRKAGSPTLLRLVEALWLQYGPSMRYIAAQYGTDPGTVDHHKSVVAALERRDGAAFVQAVHDDIAQGMAFISRAGLKAPD